MSHRKILTSYKCFLCALLALIAGSSVLPASPTPPGNRLVQPDEIQRPSRKSAGDRVQPDCGIFSLSACISSIGVEVQPDQLISPDYIGSIEGSSVGELVKAANSLKIFAKAFINLSLDELKSTQRPMILHVKTNQSDKSFHHWIAFLGFEGGRARIFDPPHEIETISPGELLARWDGVAIVISDKPIASLITFNSRFQMIFCVLFGFYLCSKLFSLSSDSIKMLSGGIWWKTAALFAVSGLGGFAFHRFSEIGFLANPAAVADVNRRYSSLNFPIIAFDEVSREIGQPGVVLIDARRSIDFRYGTIGNAINVPIDSSSLARDRALSGLSRNAQILVFCQSKGCKYSDEIASYLHYSGFRNIRIYRNGYVEWEHRP